MLLRVATNQANDVIQNLGNTICFDLFLFCSGAALFHSKKEKSVKSLLRRIWLLYFAYFIVVILSLLEIRTFTLNELLNYLFLIKLPGYAEFLIAFILYDIIYFFFKSPISWISNAFWKVLLAGLLSFVFGSLLANSGLHNSITDLIYGQKDVTTFPVMQYFIFFLLGLFYSKYKGKGNIDIKTISLITIIAGWIYLMFFFFNADFLNMLYRWPPSGLFMVNNFFLIGIFVTAATLLTGFINRFYLFFRIPSSYSLHLFYIHLMVLYVLRWIGVGAWVGLSYLVTVILIASTFIYYYAKAKFKENK